MKEIEEVWIGGLILMPATVDLGKKIKEMEDHDVFIAVTDDVSLLTEIPHWCNQSGHRLLKVERSGEELRFFIEKVSPYLRSKKQAPKDVRPVVLPQEGDDDFTEWHSW